MKRKRIARNSPQWQHVREARALLDKSHGYPVLESLEGSWAMLDEWYRVVNRDDVEGASDTPLSALMFHVEMGFYPPPELLLGLLTSWEEYIGGDGARTLEEVFLGRPVRKAGNYARRAYQRHKRMFLASEFVKLVDNGMTQAQAAEAVATRYQLRMDADSLIKIARGNWLFPPKRKKKALENPVKPVQ